MIGCGVRWDDPVVKLLLESVRCNTRGDAALQHWGEPLSQEQDLRFLSLARAHGVSPLAYYSLKDLAPAALPDKVWVGLRWDYYQAAAANTIVYKALREILAAFQQKGITVVLLKGAALVQDIYPVLALRPMSDLDILVRPVDSPQAETTLKELGYHLTAVGEDYRPLAFVRCFGGEVTYVRRAAGLASVAVELHWKPICGEWIRRLTPIETETGALMRRAQPIECEEFKALRLCPEDNLLHLALHHLVNHNLDGPALRMLADVDRLVQTAPIEWPVLMERAAAYRLRTVVYAALWLVRELLDTPVPDLVLARLSPSPWRRLALWRVLNPKVIIEYRPSGRGSRRYLLQLLLADQLRGATRLAWRAFFPEEEWLTLRYELDGSRRQIWRFRLTHPWRFLTMVR